MIKSKLPETAGLTTPAEILELPAVDAREELLQSAHYCKLELPDYFDFTRLLLDLHTSINGRTRKALNCYKARNHEDANYVIVHNKDGRLAWRQFTLVHPVLYVALINVITADENWSAIQRRFEALNCDPRFHCSSRPMVSPASKSSQGEQIHEWWIKTEQASIASALDFSHLVRTDITDCYGSIYTHAIAWAMHGKADAQADTKAKLFGNVIDKSVQDLRDGQTNGIRQGSTVMDLIAELVLAYADEQLALKLESACISRFKIIRHRDDYRIFVNEPRNGETVLKLLAEVLMELGMSLNAAKTTATDDVIGSAVKEDKLKWMFRNPRASDFQRQLLAIHVHSREFPNSGSVARALLDENARPPRITNRQMLMPTISILADIACHNPRTYPLVAGLLSRILDELKDPVEESSVMSTISKRFERLPNAELLHIWMQRVGLPIDFNRESNSNLCAVVANWGKRGSETAPIWNSGWIDDCDIRDVMKSGRILDTNSIENLPRVIPKRELDVFAADYVY